MSTRKTHPQKNKSRAPLSNKKITPMMEQYRSVKQDHPDSIVFFRMGDFYEMFDQDAIIASKIMNIALTTRDKNSDEPIPMCGVPYHAVETYLAKMIRHGKSVAICDQVEDPRLAQGIVKREVTRVITPGTLLDQGLLDVKENNYLAAISFSTDKSSGEIIRAGLSFIELSSAEFMTMEFSEEQISEKIADELVRLKPKEILVPETHSHHPNWRKIADEMPFISERTQPDWIFTDDFATNILCEQFASATLDGFGLNESHHATRSAGSIIHFLKETQKRPLTHINRIFLINTNDFMILDRVCQRNLELTQRVAEQNQVGTLLSLLDETQTPMGSRELQNWILRPLINKDSINMRQDSVQKFIEEQRVLKELRQLFSRFCDLKRITSRISLFIAHPKDLASLRDTLALLPEVEQKIGPVVIGRVSEIMANWDSLADLYDLLEQSLEDNPPLSLKDGGVIRASYNHDIEELRSLKSDTTTMIRRMELSEKERTGIPKLKIKFNKVFGYFIEITKQYLDQVPDNYIRKQTLVNAERFYTPELKDFEEKVLSAEEKIIELEKTLFEEIRSTVARNDQRILAVSRIITDIDILMSLAFLAIKHRYNRPEISEDIILNIERGIHPVMSVYGNVERFVPNDTHLDRDSEYFNIITGPNMAGKSTYIRQVALLTIMAQIGSFIPVKSATIGIVDRIFTRVGAADNLIEGQSTFMVEMVETANILHNATSKSLIILDEVGRGTSTFDGLALAWAIAEYICKKEEFQSRTLFATHYHQLTELADFIHGVCNFHVSVKEWNDQIIFLHRLVEGGTDKSYGIQVARLAGVPADVITRASEILTNLELTELVPAHLPFGIHTSQLRKTMKNGQHDPQLTLFEQYLNPKSHPIVEEIQRLDVTSLTPLDALNKLAEIQSKLASTDDET